jgi:hypothetical protein
MSNRDTRFAGFAGALIDEFWHTNLETSEQIIKCRLYDFACHIVNQVHEEDGSAMDCGLRTSQQVVNDLEDMSELPELLTPLSPLALPVNRKMRWSEMTRHDQTKWLVENILSKDGWRWEESWEAFVASTDHGETPVLPDGHVAFWQADLNVGWVIFGDDGSGDQRPFTPTESMAGAWLLIEAMKNRLYSRRERFKATLEQMVMQKHSQGSIAAHWSEILFHITPQIICEAAYKAMKGDP